MPPDERSLRAAGVLADHVKALALVRAEADGTRDVARWLERHTSTKKDTWNRRFTHTSVMDYADIVEAAEVLGLTASELVRGAETSVRGASEDGANVTPITWKRPEDMTAEELEQERSAATHDSSDPQEYPEG